MSTDAVKQTGGLKGVIQRTGKFFFASGMYARDRGKTALKWGYVYGGKTAFSIAITSMVVFMPLLFEIAREGQMIETEKSTIKDLKSRGFSDRQLQEMGFSDAAMHTPSVAALNNA